MLIRIVKLPVEFSKMEEFLNYFNLSKEKIKNFEGCSHLKLLSDLKQKNILYTYSIWESEDHLEKYLQSELFKTTWKHVRPLFFEKPEAWSLNELMNVEPASNS
ncbi:MAG: antibiotic biosynthesis monooxygenase [Bacteroidota bacterium]